MTPKQFQKYLDRDGGCIHCGIDDAVSPHHRANRGMGGSKARDVPSNIVVLCSWMNGLVESSALHAHHARLAGWKLWSTEDPKRIPLWDANIAEWVLLDDKFGREIVPGRTPLQWTGGL
jgi:hypothetical protein